MTLPTQNTLANTVHCHGIALHSGNEVTMHIKPAREDTGIVFRRTDVTSKPSEIAAHYKNVSCTKLNTTIANEAGVSVATIEHLMAAFWGCDVDNAIVEIDGPEVPIMDGSSEPFVFLLECAGKQAQKYHRTVYEVLKPVRVEQDGKFLSLLPAENFSVDLEIDFNDKVVNSQKRAFDAEAVSFKSDLCRARTFGFEHEVEYLRKQGLALGGSLENAIVIGEDKILNQDGLRYKDEFVRHKILDCIGDIYLAGAHFQGKLEGFRTGHELNNKLLHTFFADKSAWRMVEPAKTQHPAIGVITSNVPQQAALAYN